MEDLLKKQRQKKYETCLRLLSNIKNDTAKYNTELLIEYKEEYIKNGEENIPDRIIAELNCC